MRGEEPHCMGGDPVYAEHSGSEGVNLKNKPQFLGAMRCDHEMNGSGLAFWGTGRPPSCNVALPSLADCIYPPRIMGPRLVHLGFVRNPRGALFEWTLQFEGVLVSL